MRSSSIARHCNRTVIELLISSDLIKNNIPIKKVPFDLMLKTLAAAQEAS